MGKKTRGVRDGTGSYSGRIGRKRRVSAICPFDEDSVEDIKDMELEIKVKDDVKVVSDRVGRMRRRR